MNRRTLLSIQYLRGLAALAVVTFHTGWTRTEIGAAGVDLFFVISGFIMVHVSDREPGPLVFLRARVLRVVPMYWLATLVTAVVLQVTDVPRLLASFAFWPRARADGFDEGPVLIIGWTLNYEIFFYLAFAATLMLPARWRLPVLTAAFAALAAIHAIWRPSNYALAAWTHPVLLEFLAGAWLCRAWQRGWMPGYRGSLALIVLGVAALLAQAPLSGLEAWRPWAWGPSGVMLLAGGLGLEAAGRLPHVPGLHALGDASYALYLTHLLTRKALLPILLPLPLPVAFPLLIVASIVVALAVYRGIERPLGRALTRRPAAVAVS